MIASITADRESKYTLLPLSSYLVAVIENLPREDNSNSSVPCRVAGASRTQPCAASGRHQQPLALGIITLSECRLGRWKREREVVHGLGRGRSAEVSVLRNRLT